MVVISASELAAVPSVLYPSPSFDVPNYIPFANELYRYSSTSGKMSRVGTIVIDI